MDRYWPWRDLKCPKTSWEGQFLTSGYEIGVWNWQLFDSFLPLSTLLKIAIIILSEDGENEGRLIWGYDPDGAFTLSRAYRKLCTRT